MRAGLSLAIVYLAVGGLALAGVGGHGPPSRGDLAIGVALVVGGLGLLSRSRVGHYVALGAALLTVTGGLLGLLGHRDWVMPIAPAAALVVGLYLVLRTLMALFRLGGQGFLPRGPGAS